IGGEGVFAALASISIARSSPGNGRGCTMDKAPSTGAILHDAYARRESKSDAAWIIRAFPRDGHVVDVAFAQAGPGDAHELSLVVEFGEVPRADIAHGRTQAA